MTSNGSGVTKNKNNDEEDAADRQMVSGRLSAKAAAGWRNFCNANGVSLTAYLEIIGLDLADDAAPPKTDIRRRLVERAKKIDTERRRRRFEHGD